MTARLPKLGIIMGGGSAPLRLIEVCRDSGRPFFVFALEGQCDPSCLPDDVPHLWIAFGAAGRLRDKARAEGIEEFIFLGHVRRPSLSEIRPDWLALKALARIGLSMLGDDGVLRAIAAEFEREGYRVVGIQEIYRDLLMPPGILGKLHPDAQAEADLARALDIAAALGKCDAGQAAIVQQGIVLGIEAIEGTAALVARAGALRRDGPGGILVKLRKPSQDLRFDLPAIGPDTIRQAADAGLRGVAARAGETLLIDRESCIRIADEAGIFLLGLADGKDNAI